MPSSSLRVPRQREIGASKLWCESDDWRYAAPKKTCYVLAQTFEPTTTCMMGYSRDYMCTVTRAHTELHIYTRAHKHTHTHKHTNTRALARTRAHAQAHAHANPQAQADAEACTFAYACTLAHAERPLTNAVAHACARVHADAHAYTHEYVLTMRHIDVLRTHQQIPQRCTHTCTLAHTYVC